MHAGQDVDISGNSKSDITESSPKSVFVAQESIEQRPHNENHQHIPPLFQVLQSQHHHDHTPAAQHEEQTKDRVHGIGLAVVNPVPHNKRLASHMPKLEALRNALLKSGHLSINKELGMADHSLKLDGSEMLKIGKEQDMRNLAAGHLHHQDTVNLNDRERQQ